MKKEKEEKKETSAESEIVPVVSFPAEIEPIVDIAKEVKRIEDDIDKYKKVRLIALKLTNEKDWLFQENQPYLMDSGAEPIARAFGCNISLIGKPEIEYHSDEKGRYYIFTVHGKAFSRSLGCYIEDIGTCSQRDKFFGRIRGALKKLEDVDMNMIRKKAVTNLYNRITKRMVGILNVTEKELSDAGLDVKKIERIKYEKGKEKAKAELSEKDKQLKERIYNMAMFLTTGVEEEANALIKKVSTFSKTIDGEKKTFFVVKIDDLNSPRWIRTVYENMKKKFREEEKDAPWPFPLKEGEKA